MAITVLHTKVSTIPDDADTSLVRPSDWNASHSLSGVGTMAEQNATAVSVTGGTINGTTVGATTPASGAFTTLNFTGALLPNNLSGTVGQFLVSGGAGNVPTWSSSSVSAGGSTTQVQYNNAGALAGSANMTFNGTTFVLANDATINGATIGKGGGAGALNTALGNSVFAANTTGTGTGVGYAALASNTTGTLNTSVGRYSLYSNLSGINNSALGDQSLYYNYSGGNNVAIGYAALINNTATSNLTAVGVSALQNNTTAAATLGTVTGGTGYTNGTYTGVQMTRSSGSTALTYPIATIVVAGGVVSTVSITTSGGTGFKDTTTILTAPAASIGGTGSGFTIPVATLVNGSFNVGVGYQALLNNLTGGSNTAIGYQSLLNNIGSWNVGLGAYSNYSNTSGISNIAIGFQALVSNLTSSGNVGIGHNALNANTAAGNTALGWSAGTAISSGANNFIAGYNAGSALTTGSNNIILGNAAAATAVGVSNEITLGNSSITSFRIPGLTITAGAKWINVGSSTVALLPAAATAGLGARAFVTNALTPAFGSAVVGGGAVAVPVYSDGTSWLVG